MIEQLQRWRRDVVAWAEETVWTKNPMTGDLGPIRLEEHQKEFLREATRRGDGGAFVHKVAVASWPKREGKTLCVAIILAWRLACFASQKCGIIANSERQAASNIFDAVTGFFKDSPTLQGLVPEESFQTKRLTVPALDNVAECFPCNHRTVQGTRFDVLACDELHAADDGGKAYTFASQQTEAADAQVLISSQAGAPVDANPLWRLYHAAQEEEHVLFSYRQDPATPWARARAEKARAELLPGEFDYLWRNCWGATGLKLLATGDVEKAALDYPEPETAEEWRDLQRSWGWDPRSSPVIIGVGLDRAGVSRSGDRTVWTVVARWDPWGAQPVFRVVKCAVLPTGAEAELLQVGADTIRTFGGWHECLFEYYNCADVVDKIPGASLQTPTSQRQQGLFNRLYRLFKDGRMGFPAGAGLDLSSHTPGLLKQELISFEYDAQRGGLVSFGTQRGHDDTCYSLAWATEAAASVEILVEEEIQLVDPVVI